MTPTRWRPPQGEARVHCILAGASGQEPVPPMSKEDDWLLTTARAPVHRPTATAVLSALHLGYAEARRRGGEAVPAVDLDRVLAPLAAVLAPLRVRRLVIAGDLFEAGFDEEL